MTKHVEVECAKLSARQRSKLAKGQKCIVKKGSGTTLVLQESKGKGIAKKLEKGKGAMVNLNDEERKLNGEGLNFKKLGNLAKTAVGAVVDYGSKVVDKTAKYAPTLAGAAALGATSNPAAALAAYSTVDNIAGTAKQMKDSVTNLSKERIQRGISDYAQREFDARIAKEEKNDLMFYRDLLNAARRDDVQGYMKMNQQRPLVKYAGESGMYQTYAAGQGSKMLGNGLYAGTGMYAGMGHGHLARNKTKAMAEGKGLYAGQRYGRGLVGGLHQPLPTNHQALQSQNNEANRFMQFQIDSRLL